MVEQRETKGCRPRSPNITQNKGENQKKPEQKAENNVSTTNAEPNPGRALKKQVRLFLRPGVWGKIGGKAFS